MRAAAITLLVLLALAPGIVRAAGEGDEQQARDRDVAFGFLIDSPLPPAVIDESIRIAEGLRARYGLTGGEPVTDRQAAAARTLAEFLSPLQFSRRQIARQARRMGYSLDPERCANYCRNIEQLAILELQRQALRRLATSAQDQAGARARPGGS